MVRNDSAKRIGSSGTLVLVENVFKRIPIRRKSLVHKNEMDKLLKMLVSLSVVHHSLNFALEDLGTAKLMFNARATSFYVNSLCNIPKYKVFDCTVSYNFNFGILVKKMDSL